MTRSRHGFSIVEFAVVLVVAGALAIVAVPLYKAYIDDAKWDEASAVLEQAYVKLYDYEQEYGAGALQRWAGQPVSAFAEQVGLDEDLFKGLRYFGADDFVLKASPGGDVSAGQYQLEAHGSLSSSPDGVMVLTADNTLTMP